MTCCPPIAPFPFALLPQDPVQPDRRAYPEPPDERQCFALWDKYKMLPNIRSHSLLVAHIATTLAARALEVGIETDVAATRAAGLLHDIAKTWSLEHGGSHAILGASWTMQETRHYGIAQGVILHVHWPWPLPEGATICCLPIFVIYADKRVRHDKCVSLEQRFEDLITRYGKTGEIRANIRKSQRQAELIEQALSRELKWDLHENSFDSGRLVERT